MDDDGGDIDEFREGKDELREGEGAGDRRGLRTGESDDGERGTDPGTGEDEDAEELANPVRRIESLLLGLLPSLFPPVVGPSVWLFRLACLVVASVFSFASALETTTVVEVSCRMPDDPAETVANDCGGGGSASPEPVAARERFFIFPFEDEGRSPC